MSSYRVSATGGIKYYYETEGTKQPIIFLHGMGDNCGMWWNQWKSFSGDFRYCIPDMRGMGKSEKTKGEYTIELLGNDMSDWWRYAKMQMAQDCENHDELAEIQKLPPWVGYSMGGRVALQVAASHPEYFKGLALVSCGIGLNKRTPEAQKRYDDMIALLQKNDMKKWAEMATDAAFSPGFKQKNGKAWEQYMKVKLQQKNDAVLSYMMGMAKAGAPDLTRVKFPVLFVVGQNDPSFTPEQAKQAQAALPNSKVVVLPTGHCSPIEAPEEFNKTILDFYASLK